jgi:hypothetical protein
MNELEFWADFVASISASEFIENINQRFVS